MKAVFPRSSGRRRWAVRLGVLGLLAVVFGPVLLWWASPLWLPWALEKALDQQGGSMGDMTYSRSGGWAVQAFEWENDALSIRVDSIQLPSAYRYLRGRYGKPQLPPVHVAGVTVTIHEQDAYQEPATNEPVSIPRVIRQIESQWLAIEPWLPPLKVENISIRLAAEEPLVAQVSELTLRGREVAIRAEQFAYRVTFAGEIQAVVSLAESGTRMQLELAGSVTDLLAEWEDPVYLELRASGDRDGIFLQQAIARGEGIDVSLSEPVALRFADLSFSADAKLSVGIDLAAQRIYPLDSGSIEAVVRIEDGRVLNVERAEVVMPMGIGSGSLTGVIDPLSDHLDLTYRVDVDNDWLSGMQLPVGIPDGIVLLGSISGGLRTPSTRVEVSGEGWQLPGIRPLSFESSMQMDFSGGFETALVGRCADASLELALTGKLGAEAIDLSVGQFSLTIGDEAPLVMESPAGVRIPFGGKEPTEAGMQVGPIVLRNGDTRIEVEWRDGRYLESSGDRLHIDFLNGVLLEPLPSLFIRSWEVAIDHGGEVLRGNVTLSADALSDEGIPVSAALIASLQAHELIMSQLEIKVDQTAVVAGDLTIPLSILLPGNESGKLLDWSRTAALSGELQITDSPALKAIIREQLDLQIGTIELSANLAGSIEAPQAALQGRIADVSYSGSVEFDRPLPPIRDLEFVVHVDPRIVRVETIEATMLADSRFSLSGEFDYPQLVRTLMDGRSAAMLLQHDFTGRIMIDQWRGEDWAEYLPALIRPSGIISGDVTVQRGLQLQGSLDVMNLSLRPTASMPSVSEISGHARFEDDRLSLSSGRAKIAGQLVEVFGHFSWRDLSDPVGEIGIRAERIPLVRTSTVMLRSDVDIKLIKAANQAPRIVGTLNLQNSTVLYDFDLLGARTASGTAPRPPFFAIEAAPFSDWEIDLQIQGEEFLRLRSAYFAAQFSAQFRLSGTLGDPLLLGSARAVSGDIRFPGARMRLQQAELLIGRDQPNEMQLFVNGISERASYVISMDVTGTVSDPRVHFQSTPSLNNAAIIRLLTTGSLSSTNISGIGLYLGQGLLGPGSADESWLNRLNIEVGRDISRSGRNTIDAQFDLSESWYLQGQYDRFDAYNIDLVRKIFSR